MQLLDILKTLDPDKILMKPMDRSPITAGEMIGLLERNDPIGADFADTIFRIAIDILVRRNKSSEPFEMT